MLETLYMCALYTNPCNQYGEDFMLDRSLIVLTGLLQSSIVPLTASYTSLAGIN